MSDTAPRNPTAMPRMLADALLRGVAGTSAQLRVTAANTSTSQSELGIVSTTFYEAVISPVVIRRLQLSGTRGGQPECELLVSATSIDTQLSTLDLPSAQALFNMTLAVTVAGQDYLIESIASNEAFGQVYMYRLMLREARPRTL